jgi:hypothetical protein
MDADLVNIYVLILLNVGYFQSEHRFRLSYPMTLVVGFLLHAVELRKKESVMGFGM